MQACEFGACKVQATWNCRSGADGGVWGRSAREVEGSREVMFRLALPHPHISFHLLDRTQGKTVIFLKKVRLYMLQHPDPAWC